MDAQQLNLAGFGLAVTDFSLTRNLVALRLESQSSTAVCPRCGVCSERIHSRYLRKLADLACHGRSVLIRLRVRRFRCTNATCSQMIFCERLPDLVEPHARTTARLHGIHRLVGLALGGEAGSRMTDDLAISTSADTILRRVKSVDDPEAPPPRFVGIDDWALRRGQRYGTIVVDLERGCVVDLLPDRDAETVKKWLNEHPGVEIITRDRWPAYARAATEAAPASTAGRRPLAPVEESARGDRAFVRASHRSPRGGSEVC
ncbi:MAG: ISL3 family transposase [Planctomycetota bacterium]|nr:ISL3 family transposase [Planctomycetota bacterium]